MTDAAPPCGWRGGTREPIAAPPHAAAPPRQAPLASTSAAVDVSAAGDAQGATPHADADAAQAQAQPPPRHGAGTVGKHQSDKSLSGNQFERSFAATLTASGRAFYHHVPMLHDGTLLLAGDARAQARMRQEHVGTALVTLDFVLPLGAAATAEDAAPPTHITEAMFVSLKRSCRERWLEDAWTLYMQPLAFALVVETLDFPLSGRFKETATRLLIAPRGKATDTRAAPHTLAELPQILAHLDAAVDLLRLQGAQPAGW